MVPVVVGVGVETAEPEVGADRDAGLERQHGELGLAFEVAVVVVVCALVALRFLELVVGRKCRRVGCQTVGGGERGAVELAVARLAGQ